VTNKLQVEVDLHFQDYLGHAHQSDESKLKIALLLEKGPSEPDI